MVVRAVAIATATAIATAIAIAIAIGVLAVIVKLLYAVPNLPLFLIILVYFPSIWIYIMLFFVAQNTNKIMYQIL